MTYEKETESKVVCNECKDPIKDGEDILCWSCWDDFKNDMRAMEEKLARKKKNIAELKDQLVLERILRTEF